MLAQEPQRLADSLSADSVLAPDSLAALPDSAALPVQVPDSAQVAPLGADPFAVEPDADGDGVPVFADWCPDTAPGVTVDERGCSTGRLPWWGWAGAVAVFLAGLTALRRAILGAMERRRRARIARYGRDVEREVETLARTLEPGAGVAGLWPPWMAEPPPAPEESPTPAPQSRAPIPSSPREVGFPQAPAPPPLDLDLVGTRVPSFAAPAGTTGTEHPLPEDEPSEPYAPSSADIPRGISEWQQHPLRFDESDGRRRGPGAAVLFGVGIVVAASAVALVARIRGNEDPLAGARTPVPVPGHTPVVVAFTDDTLDPGAEPGTRPARMLLIAGDGQQGAAGSGLPEPIAVRVEDAGGVPVPRVRVHFEATVGGGEVRPPLALTDSLGVARALWLLGRAAERQYVIARVEGYEEGAGVAFEALATAGQASGIRLLAGDGQAGTANLALDSAVLVQVQDARGNPVPGVMVEFVIESGDGTVSPASAESDSSGVVRASWTLGESSLTPALRARIRDQSQIAVLAHAALVYPRLSVQAGVVTGGTHTCQLGGNGRVRCWGSNQTGQLGTGAGSSSRVPAASGGGYEFSAIAAGLAHTCGVTPEGEALCWGDNANGQLGTGDAAPHLEPTPVKTQVRFRSISAGPAHTCAVSRAGQGYCWGSNANGQLGDGGRTDRLEPVAIALRRPLQEVSPGWTHTCALAVDGTAYCWGRNAFGQLGDGGDGDRVEPRAIGGERRFRHIAAGSAHTCAVQSDGTLSCWGQNSYGQLGTGDREGHSEPTPVEGGPWRAVSTGGVHTCALDGSGAVFCWGRNTYGQLGDGTTEDRPSPAPVSGGLVFNSLQASGAHTCGMESSGRTWCWGFNVEGQLGDGSRQNRAVPTRVGGG